MKKKICTLLAAIAATFLFIGCSNNSERTSDEFLDITNSGMITSLGVMEYDWGKINIEDGNVMKEFVMRNDGNADLYLKGAATSCMCTTAEYLLPDGTTSPKFGMHNNIMDWVYAVRPGEEFTIRATFDPLAHGPKGTGPIQRSVVVISSSEPNDIAQVNYQEKRGTVTGFMLKGDVLSKEDFAKMQESMGGIDGSEMQMSEGSGKSGGSMDGMSMPEAKVDEIMEGHDNEEYASLPEYEISNRDVIKGMLAKSGAKLIDVREESELKETGVLEGAMHLPLGEISMNAMEERGIAKDDEVVVYCKSGNRSRQAYEMLKTLGYTNVKSMHGGIVHWMEDKLPVEPWVGNSASSLDQKKNLKTDLV